MADMSLPVVENRLSSPYSLYGGMDSISSSAKRDEHVAKNVEML